MGMSVPEGLTVVRPPVGSVEVRIAYTDEVGGPGAGGLCLSPVPWISVDGRPWKRANERSVLKLKKKIIEAVESLAVKEAS